MSTHTTNDPQPPAQDADDTAFTTYRQNLTTYTSEWMERYENLEALTASTVWADFTTDFSEIALQNLPNDSVLFLRDFLMKNGIHIVAKRGFPRRDALRDCLKSDECPERHGQQETNNQPSREQRTETTSPDVEKNGSDRGSDLQLSL